METQKKTHFDAVILFIVIVTWKSKTSFLTLYLALSGCVFVSGRNCFQGVCKIYINGWVRQTNTLARCKRLIKVTVIARFVCLALV